MHVTRKANCREPCVICWNDISIISVVNQDSNGWLWRRLLPCNSHYKPLNWKSKDPARDMPLLIYKVWPFRNDCKCFAHIKAKLCKANKCGHVLRVCRKKCYCQTEIDSLFYSIVLPNITYGLSVYGASVAEINVLQQFLDRRYKLRFISTQLNNRSLLQKQDHEAIFKKVKQRDPSEGLLTARKEQFNLQP